jgi:hypothetical protein
MKLGHIWWTTIAITITNSWKNDGNPSNTHSDSEFLEKWRKSTEMKLGCDWDANSWKNDGNPHNTHLDFI